MPAASRGLRGASDSPVHYIGCGATPLPRRRSAWSAPRRPLIPTTPSPFTPSTPILSQTTPPLLRYRLPPLASKLPPIPTLPPRAVAPHSAALGGGTVTDIPQRAEGRQSAPREPSVTPLRDIGQSAAAIEGAQRGAKRRRLPYRTQHRPAATGGRPSSLVSSARHRSIISPGKQGGGARRFAVLLFRGAAWSSVGAEAKGTQAKEGNTHSDSRTSL